jgi:hypothetical protein
MYQVNDGKMEALIARFGDHTDAIFKWHNMKSIGFWRPQDEPFSQNLLVYILEHPTARKQKRIGLRFRPIRNGKGKSRFRGSRRGIPGETNG